ncbi:Tetratricopeptide repeat [Phytophthora infestans]|uniref:Tetratricopeptide repeat n=1 Tax=Phytophthora infestans TaxID=4787 RepID=A0A833W6R6_PHYIN|nr:Tetratricopeptide repeat [Phytophthora infestans]
MRLYVHYEPSDEALAWTKRLNLPPVDEASACPSVRSVLRCFFTAYNAKFRSKLPPEPENVDVYVEYHKNAASRRLLQSLDVSVAQIGSSGGCTDKILLRSGKTCDFELVVVPKEPQRKVLGPEPPQALRTKIKCLPRSESSEEDDRDPKLRRVLELAATYMKQRKFRAARDIYTDVVMEKHPLNAEALVALGEILMANGKHEEAVENYFLKCWKAHGGDTCAWKAHAKVAFTAGLRLAECYVELGTLNEAVRVLDEVQTFLRWNSVTNSGESKRKVFFPDADERLLMEEQMDVLKARALYDTKSFENQETAISLIMHLLPDLTAPTLNLDALLLYAGMAHDRGKKSEALSMALRVLVGKSNDRAVKRTFVSFLKDSGWMERLKSAVPPCGPSAAAAYAFIATILKDFGAVEKAILCFQLAQDSDPLNASYALNHAHALEACCRYTEAFHVLTTFFRKNCTLNIGTGGDETPKLMAGSFVEILDRAKAWEGEHNSKQAADMPNNIKEGRWRVEWISGDEGYAKVTPPASESKLPMGNVKVAPLNLQTVQANKKTSATLSDAELDLLACFFTIVKILFINDRLLVLPALIRVLEPLRLGRELHRTTIRNEQAYYACIAQLLSVEKALVMSPPASPDASIDAIYVCGDSHTLATAWREINVEDRSILLRPALVTGLKHWHLRKESTFYPKLNFWRVLANIPNRSRVIFLFGEIDCRVGILEAVEKCKYETIEEGMKHTIDIFMDVLSDVVEKYAFDVYIHPVVPVLDETRLLVIQYNKLFEKRVVKSSICKWLDFFDELVCEDPPKLRPNFRLDGTHMHPSYLSTLAAAFKRTESR